ncbi:hypothetical protein [Spirosoma montaniterrae]|uniref:hypothetical protein n=1 Tax=Spirosoma montaniterrae TaxID=1178516 RepID=UPI0018DE1C70|nr:hypothetical protein [Spirosoma montaniterrae]
MFKQFISAIPGADVYMVGSFLTFLIFFVLVGLYLLLADKEHLRHISQLPLDDTSV